jgi:hypothetical protein
VKTELDHVFVCCDAGAPEADFLARRGLLEGSGNTHPGQGTANRRFFFANAYLELMWVCDSVEAQSPEVLPTQLWERWNGRSSGACPFGIVFRPGAGSSGQAPFLTWSYRPAYLPSGCSIEVGRGLALSEPQLFYLPFARNRDGREAQPRMHPAGINCITDISVSIPHEHQASSALERAIDADLLTVRRGAAYVLELGYDGDQGAPLDLRPNLPLLFVPRKSQRENGS